MGAHPYLRRSVMIFLVMVLTLSGMLVKAPPARATGAWLTTGPMSGPRAFHTTTLLTNGWVLVTGGVDPTRSGVPPVQHLPLATAERYDPGTNRWVTTAPPGFARYDHAAILLPDGRVLVAGGTVGNEPTDTAELYDPVADIWTPAATMLAAHRAPTATLLPDGTVLLIGTGSTRDAPLAVERYDPTLDRWIPAANMRIPRSAHTATLLPDGRVLVVGGLIAPSASCQSTCYTTTVELYDPLADVWNAAAPKPGAFGAQHAATLLPDGQVLVTGGCCDPSARHQAARYDPPTNTWVFAGGATKSFLGPAVSLPGGRVLIVLQGIAEIYDAAIDRWSRVPGPNTPRNRHTLIPLADGRILVVAGTASNTSPVAEIYDPTASPEGACFGPTENAADAKCLPQPFFEYWQTHGGLALHGYPLTEVRREKLEDGAEYTVQYFERTRLEFHPENSPPNNILLGQFGRRIRPADPPAPRVGIPGSSYFPETGHNLSEGFLTFWGANGGLAQFGYPISEVFVQELQDGKMYRVQYFERARFEYHPENAAPYDILLGQFGRIIVAGAGR